MARIGLKLREVRDKAANKLQGARLAADVLREGIKSGKISKEDISLREMAESLIGPDWAAHLRTVAARGAETQLALRESVDAVDSSGFSAITGQLFVDEVKDKYKLATFVTDQMFRTVKVTNGNLGTHIVPYLTDTLDDPGIVNQGQQYPATSFSGQYITLAAPEKYGRICQVTFEAIYSDLTKQILDSAGSVGRRVGLWVEKKRLRVALGLVNNYVWNGTSYNTYQTSTWDNSLTDFTLTNWTSINTLEQKFANMLDPVLNEPIEIEGGQLLVMPKLKYTAKRIISATEVRSGDITTGTGDQLVSANPLDGGYSLMTSKHARRQLRTFGSATFTTDAIADSLVLFGDFKKAFYWREVFPMQTVQAPPMNPAEFNQDIVFSVKANVFGVAGVWEPRYVVRAYNASA